MHHRTARTTVAATIAGLVLAAAHTNAQSFNYQLNSPNGEDPSSSRVFVADSGTNVLDSVVDRPGDQNHAVSGFGSDAASTSTDSLTRLEATWDGTPTSVGDVGLAGGLSLQNFTVSDSYTLRFSWDLAGTDFNDNTIFPPNPISSRPLLRLAAYDQISGEFFDTVLETRVDATNPTGSADIVVELGEIYQLTLFLGYLQHFEPDKTSFVQAELIPAPGAAGLLGIAGIAAARRRRR